MTIDEVQHIVDYAYPNIKKYYGKAKKSYPVVELHKDIYARLSGDPKQRGEESKSSEAQYEYKTNIIFVYYPNMRDEEHVIRSLIHEYTHYTQNITPFLKKYHALHYTYLTDPHEIEAHKAEENWQMFSRN